MNPRKTRINPISDRQKVRNRQYAKAKKEWWKRLSCDGAVKVRCALWPRCNREASRTPHHIFGRLNLLLCDDRLWLAVCQPCHDDIHNNPRWAEISHYLPPKGWFNRNPFTEKGGAEVLKVMGLT